MTNQSTNPSFEVDLSDWVHASGTAPTTARVNEQAYAGSWSMLVTANATANTTMRHPVSGTTIPVSPGQVWSMGVRARWKTGTPKSMRCDLRWMASGSVESTSAGSNATAQTPNTSGWTTLVQEGVTAPADAVGLRARIIAVSCVIGDEFYLDGFQVEQAATLPAYNEGLATPTGLTATAVSSTQINVSWSAVSGATGYDLERNGSQILTNHSTTSYSNTGLTPSTTYTYRVRARAV